MPTRSKTGLCLLSTALLLLNACKPDKPKEKKYMGYYPLGVVKDYLYFKPGSYWVYECDSTNELDSQVMLRCDTPWIKKSYIDYQLLFFTRKSIPYKVLFSTDGYYQVPYNEKFTYFDAYNINTSGGGISAYDCIFYYPFDSTKFGSGSSPTYYKGHYDSMQVLGRWYKDVRVFKVQVTSGWIKLNSWRLPYLDRYASIEYYWSKNIGLIRTHVIIYDILNRPFIHNWNLKRYLVKQ